MGQTLLMLKLLHVTSVGQSFCEFIDIPGVHSNLVSQTFQIVWFRLSLIAQKPKRLSDAR